MIKYMRNNVLYYDIDKKKFMKIELNFYHIIDLNRGFQLNYLINYQLLIKYLIHIIIIYTTNPI